MNPLLSILIFLLSINIGYSQDWNKKNRYGQYVGKWVEYYPEGYIKSIRYYTPLEFKPDTFLLPTANSESFDTLISPNTDLVKKNTGYEVVSDKDEYNSHRDWTQIFEYAPNWKLKRVFQTDSIGKSIFLYGMNQEIGVENQSAIIEGKVGASYQITFPIKNLSDSAVPLRFENLPKNIRANDSFLIPARSDHDIILNVSPDAEYRMYKIDLIGENILIEFSINTRGYHFTTSEFKAVGPIVITQRNIVIKRENSEALISILKRSTGKVVKRIPLSKPYASADLTDLPSGEYVFEIRDYSKDTKISKEVTME